MKQMAWDAGQSLKFGEERTQPARDLLARVEQAYPRRADGKVLFPFRRLFLVASRRET